LDQYFKVKLGLLDDMRKVDLFQLVVVIDQYLHWKSVVRVFNPGQCKLSQARILCQDVSSKGKGLKLFKKGLDLIS
jgi:hypothetical protein